jgi:UDP-glucose 4-epimerase
MGLCDVRDMIQGIALAATHPAAEGEVFNIGPAESFEFSEAVAHLAEVTGLDVQRVTLHTATYRYDTSIEKARERLGFEPKWTIQAMIDDAARRNSAS